MTNELDPDIPVIPESIAKLERIFCGCATAENTWGAVLGVLGNPDCVEDQVVHHLLEHLGLTEHGSSVRCSWLTPDGEEALAFLRNHSIYWRQGSWQDSRGVYVGSLP